MPASPTPPNYLSINEAAEITGCAPITIRRLISRGEIKAKRLARRILIAPRDLERAMTPVTRLSAGDADD